MKSSTIFTPSNLVLDIEDKDKLPFDGKSWTRIVSFSLAAQKLPRTASELPPGIREAFPDASQRAEVVSGLGALQSQGLVFGSPPATTHAGPEPDGQTIYGRIREFVSNLHDAADQVASELRELEKSVSDEMSNEARSAATRAGLQQMAEISARRMDEATPILLQLDGWSSEVSTVMAVINQLQTQTTKLMSSAQESVGGLEYTIRTRTQQLEETSIFHPGRKRKAAEELEDAKARLPAAKGQADGFRELVAMLENLVRLYAWLPTGIGTLKRSLSTTRQQWSQLGTRLRQLSTDADSATLGDVEWVSTALDPGGTAVVWDRLAAAMTTFLEDNK